MPILIYNGKEIIIQPNSSKEHIFIRFESKEDLNAFWDEFEDGGYKSYIIKNRAQETEAHGSGLTGVVIKYKYELDIVYIARFDVTQSGE